MDDIRGSFSKLKKDIKHRLAGSKRRADKIQAGGGGETVDSSGPSPQPVAVRNIISMPVDVGYEVGESKTKSPS